MRGGEERTWLCLYFNWTDYTLTEFCIVLKSCYYYTNKYFYDHRIQNYKLLYAIINSPVCDLR